MRKAKIVDTIGPSTEDYDNLLKLVEAGMDVARLNRSHGTPEDHLKVYNNVRKASEATGRNVAALVDLQGPKIRCGWFKKNAAKPLVATLPRSLICRARRFAAVGSRRTQRSHWSQRCRAR